MRKRARDVYTRDGISLGSRDSDAGPVYVADCRKVGGKRVTLGQYTTEIAARAALDQFVDRRRLLLAQMAKHTIGDLWTMWMDYREKDKLNNKIYEHNWTAMKGHFANRRPEQLTDEDWREYAKHRFALGRSAWTVHTELSRLSNCLKWAVKNKKLSEEPIIWLPRRGESRKLVLTPMQVLAIVSGAGDHHVRIFIMLALMTGARHTAILDLEWDRVDFEAGTVNFEIDVEYDPMSKSWTKGRATVPMGKTLRRELELAYSIRQTKFVVEHGGKRLKSAREGFKNAVERANAIIGGLGSYEENDKGELVFVTDITPHVMRHTVNTWLREGSIGAEDRAQMLGQLDVEVNKREYTHASHKVLTGAVQLIETTVGAVPQKGEDARVAPAKKPRKRVSSSILAKNEAGRRG